jgi:methylated-DNA-protein-cysteine methyltransferase-like protein
VQKPKPPRIEAHALECDARERAILEAVRSIPPGQVRSYAAVARAAGWPRHARLVAKVLSRSGSTGLPWHRVLRADGRIAFPESSPAWLEQSRRLLAEGVDVVEGRVRSTHRTAAVSAGLDAALWGAG